MNKIRWRILWAICLLLSAIPITTTVRVWASALQPPTLMFTQMQGQGVDQQNTKGMVTLLLQDEEEQQAFLNQNVQMIVGLLLEEEQEQEAQETKQIFLPLVTR